MRGPGVARAFPASDVPAARRFPRALLPGPSVSLVTAVLPELGYHAFFVTSLYGHQTNPSAVTSHSEPNPK